MGQAISRRIVDMGYRVYGLGQFKKGSAFEHRQFHPLGCDITKPAEIAESLDGIMNEKQVVSVLIHAASFSIDPKKDPEYFSDVEPGAIEALLRIQFLGPLLLTRMLLPQLKQGSGHILFLTPQSESLIKLNPARTASVSAIRHFAQRLFDQECDTGLRVTSLILQPNQLAREAQKAGTSPSGQELINPKQVAEAAEQILRTAAEGNVVTELVLRPQIKSGSEPVPKTRASIDPYREIMLPPSQHFPKEPVPLVIPQTPSASHTITPEELERTPLPKGVKGNEESSSSQGSPRRKRGRRRSGNQSDSNTRNRGDQKPRDDNSGDLKSDSKPPKDEGKQESSEPKKKSAPTKRRSASKKKASDQKPAPAKKKTSPPKKQAAQKSAPRKKRASRKYSESRKRKQNSDS